jgi:hypothetical protein
MNFNSNIYCMFISFSDVFDFGDCDEDFDGIVPTSQQILSQFRSQGTCFGTPKEFGMEDDRDGGR